MDNHQTVLIIDRLIDTMNEKFPSESLRRGCTIRRVPPPIRQADQSSYNPKLISIGPLHRGKPELQAMQDVKWLYLRSLISRTTTSEVDAAAVIESEIKKYVEVISKLEVDARRQYAEKINLSSSDFVAMMVMDACFIIELLIRYSTSTSERDADDPLQADDRIPDLVRVDLLMLENQIPFFILKALYQSLIIQEFIGYEGLTITLLALYYVSEREIKDVSELPEDIHHLLHLLLSILTPTLPPSKPQEEEAEQEEQLGIPTVSELINKVGVKVKIKKSDKNFLNVSFHNGTLEMAPFKIEESTMPVILNMIAFEHVYVEQGKLWNKCCTTYAWFMDNLVNDEKDVETLRGEGILETNLGRDKQVVDYLNKLSIGQALNYRKHYLKIDVFDKMNRFHRNRQKQWLHTFKQEHLEDPWKVFALILGILLTLITLVSAIFEYPKVKV